MIDIKELRRLAQAAIAKMNASDPEFASSTPPLAILELLDRLEAAEKERDDAKAAAENIALKLDYLRSKFETAKNAQNDWLRANAPGGWIDNLRIENEALRAENERIDEAMESLLIRCDDSDSAMYGTLSTRFVRDTVRIARGAMEESK